SVTSPPPQPTSRQRASAAIPTRSNSASVVGARRCARTRSRSRPSTPPRITYVGIPASWSIVVVASVDLGIHRREAELAVVPADVLVDVDLHDDALVQHLLDERLHLGRVLHTVVTLEHADPELEHPLRVIDDLGRAHHLDADE